MKTINIICLVVLLSAPNYSQVKKVDKYKTSDGKEFASKVEANVYEYLLKNRLRTRDIIAVNSYDMNLYWEVKEEYFIDKAKFIIDNREILRRAISIIDSLELEQKKDIK